MVELTIVQIQKKDGTSKDSSEWIEDGWKLKVYIGGIRVFVRRKPVKHQSKNRVRPEEEIRTPFRTFFQHRILEWITTWSADGGIPSSTILMWQQAWECYGMWVLNWMAAQRISKAFYWELAEWIPNSIIFKFENRDFQAVRGDNQYWVCANRNDVRRDSR